MIIDGLLAGDGMVRADWALTVLLASAAAMSWWSIAFRGHSVGVWMMGLGFSIQTVRMVFDLLTGGDPPISPIGLISFSLVSLGWVIYIPRRRKYPEPVAARG